MTGLCGQLFEILQLGPTIAFAERMDVVHIAHDPASHGGEGGWVQAAQEVCPRQPPMDIGHAGLDEPAELELVAILGDLDRAKFTGPREEVLKQVAVDRAEMGEVEVACRGAFRDPLRDKLTFDRVETFRVCDAESVYENR